MRPLHNAVVPESPGGDIRDLDTPVADALHEAKGAATPKSWRCGLSIREEMGRSRRLVEIPDIASRRFRDDGCYLFSIHFRYSLSLAGSRVFQPNLLFLRDLHVFLRVLRVKLFLRIQLFQVIRYASLTSISRDQYSWPLVPYL